MHEPQQRFNNLKLQDLRISYIYYTYTYYKKVVTKDRKEEREGDMWNGVQYIIFKSN